MFESANCCTRWPRPPTCRNKRSLRAALLKAQYDLKLDGRFPVLILIAGVEGAGKGETVNLLNEWMDPRHIQTTAFGTPSDEEAERPAHWRFWRALPPKGRIGIFFGAWHTQPIVQRVMGQIDAGTSPRHRRHPAPGAMLCDEGVLLLKYWFHLSKEQQKQAAEGAGKGPRHALARDRHRLGVLQALRPLRRGLRPLPAPDLHRAGALDRGARGRPRLPRADGRPPPAGGAARSGWTKSRPAPRRPTPPLPHPADPVNVLSALQLDQPLDKAAYERALTQWQGRLNLASRDPRFKALSVVAVFEGNDGAGKGGAIRRVTGALDARCVQHPGGRTHRGRACPALPVALLAPVAAARAFAFFDRSWYGRVLVERIEGFCSRGRLACVPTARSTSSRRPAAAPRGAGEVLAGDRQGRAVPRFKLREEVAFKRFKITAEDWRNREKWDAYEAAVCDMVDRTSTAATPVDAGGGQQQVPRPHQGAEDLVRGGGAGLGPPGWQARQGHQDRKAAKPGKISKAGESGKSGKG
jgi:polyphosphate kinase 2 (PPK2 family)